VRARLLCPPRVLHLASAPVLVSAGHTNFLVRAFPAGVPIGAHAPWRLVLGGYRLNIA
jgi:hypothetical protein